MEKYYVSCIGNCCRPAVTGFSSAMSGIADLNEFEAETPGEFGIGSAAQFGSADLRKIVHVNENFRRANFKFADTKGIWFQWFNIIWGLRLRLDFSRPAGRRGRTTTAGGSVDYAYADYAWATSYMHCRSS